MKPIHNSEVLYVEPDKKRTVDWLDGLGLQLPSYADNHGSVDTWLQSVGLQLPSGKTMPGVIGQVTYSGDIVDMQGQKLPFTTLNIVKNSPGVNSEHEIFENSSLTAPKRAENGCESYYKII